MRSNKTSIFNKRHSQGGLTVVEVLIGITVIAVVFMLGAPGLGSLVQDHYLEKTSGKLLVSLSLAQTEASRRHSIVRMCPSSDGLSCRNDGDWNRGWMVFTDGNANGIPETIEILEAVDAPADKIRVRATGALTETASFTVAGLSPANNAVEGMFSVCHADRESGSRRVIVDANGYMQLVPSEATCTKS